VKNRYLIYITLILAPLIPPCALSAQNADSITVIQSKPKVTGDTTTYTNAPKSQPKPQKPDNFWRRVSVGGWVSLQFGTITAIGISPEVKVRLVDQLYAGFGLTYQYAKYNNWYHDSKGNYYDLSSNTYGERVFLRYYLSGLVNNWLGNFFAHVEYEHLQYVSSFVPSSNGPYTDPNNHSYSKGHQVINITSVFVGGGYRQPVSSKVFFDFLILFNLNDTPDSPYTNPVFRFGVGAGL
jgi:hypothetical protein